MVALGLALGASAAQAQRSRVTLDVTSARMRYADSVSATAFSLSPNIRAASDRTSVDAAGTLSRLDGGTTASGAVDASFLAVTGSRVTPELDFVAGGSTHSDGGRTGQFLGTARLHIAAPTRGLWIGAGAGRTWDGAWRDVFQGDVGAWVTAGENTASVTITPTSVDDTIRYSDAVVSFRRESGALELAASLGIRGGDRMPSLPANRSTWGGVSAAYWMDTGVALVANVGSYPVDFTQGFPGGRYLSVGLRFGVRRAGTASMSAPSGKALAGGIRGFDAVRVGAAAVRFRVRAPGATKVEIAGDFTAWDPVPLERVEGDWWTTTIPVAPGTHQLNVRLDGGPWRVPPSLTPLTDEFGVVSGLLDVPR